MRGPQSPGLSTASLPSFLAALPPGPSSCPGSLCILADSSHCLDCLRAEEEEGRPGPAGDHQQEPGQEGEQGDWLKLSETQGAAATARDSGAAHVCWACLGTGTSLQARAEEPRAAWREESFPEVERRGSAYTYTPPIHAHLAMSRCATRYTHACAHTHNRGHQKTLPSCGLAVHTWHTHAVDVSDHFPASKPKLC